MNRRDSATMRMLILALVGIVGTFATTTSAGEPDGADTVPLAAPPNVVVILADDLGYSDLGCYGGQTRTPQLDRLAAEGLRYSQFYNTGRCWPTRASLLTGYYPQQVRRDAVPGVRSGGGGVRPEWATLLPQRLAAAGYRSYHVGKWHVDGTPLVGGFDHSYRLDDHGRYFGPRAHYDDDRRLPTPEADAGFYVTTEMGTRAAAMLDEHRRDHAERPFFLYLAFTAPHFPLQALQEDIDRYAGVFDRGWEVSRAERLTRQRELGLPFTELSAVEPAIGPPYAFPEAMNRFGPDETNRPVPWESLGESQRRLQATKMAIHAAMIDRMDREIGRVIERLEAHGVLDDTLILFLSDNGASAEMMIRDDGHDPTASPGSAPTHFCLGPGWSNVANTPFRRHKTWVHEGGIRTPLIVRWPAGIPREQQGSWRSAPGHAIDLVPTLLELAGLDTPHATESIPELAGRSLVPTFASDETLDRPWLWWSHEGNRALRIGDRKLVVAGADGAWELYDLATDPTESRDLAERMPEVRDAMIERWRSIDAEFTATALRGIAPPTADR